jgi:GNAT superfamily N-acetyltransferase
MPVLDRRSRGTSDQLHVRRISAADDLHALTELIHAAYAPHSASGLRYWATHQSVADTEKRIARGVCFVGEVGGKVIATIALTRPDPNSKVDLLREPHTWSFGQFAVAPTHKGRGIGKQLHDAALLEAAALGCQVMALHTAQPAVALIDMYRSWGYTEAGTFDWRPHTNYLSVLMSKTVRSAVEARGAV